MGNPVKLIHLYIPENDEGEMHGPFHHFSTYTRFRHEIVWPA